MIIYHKLEVAAGKSGGVVENVVINIIINFCPHTTFSNTDKDGGDILQSTRHLITGIICPS